MQRIRTISQLGMEVKITCHQSLPIYQILSPKIKELNALGLSNKNISAKLKIDKKTVAKGLAEPEIKGSFLSTDV